MRLLLALLGVALLLFSGFGLAATFEPLDGETVATWRLIHGAGALAGLLLVVWALRRRPEG